MLKFYNFINESLTRKIKVQFHGLKFELFVDDDIDEFIVRKILKTIENKIEKKILTKENILDNNGKFDYKLLNQYLLETTVEMLSKLTKEQIALLKRMKIDEKLHISKDVEFILQKYGNYFKNKVNKQSIILNILFKILLTLQYENETVI